MPLFGCCIRKVEDVKILDFRHCGLGQVPNAVFNAERTIELLHIDSNQIKSLPRVSHLSCTIYPTPTRPISSILHQPVPYHISYTSPSCTIYPTPAHPVLPILHQPILVLSNLYDLCSTSLSCTIYPVLSIIYLTTRPFSCED